MPRLSHGLVGYDGTGRYWPFPMALSWAVLAGSLKTILDAMVLVDKVGCQN